MHQKLISMQDLEFQLYRWLKVESLCERSRYQDHGRETFDAAIDLSLKLAHETFAPLLSVLDQNEPHFDGEKVQMPDAAKSALRHFCEAGLMAAGHDAELGGMQLPCVIEKACFALFNAANVALAAYPMLTIGNANLLLAHGSQAQIDRFARPQIEGRWFGTMCLSEPQAGSSLSDIRTRALPDGDDPSGLGARYRLFGNKMWISGGEHELSPNIIHLVLAKIPQADGQLPSGVKGISLFVVPKHLVDQQGRLTGRNDVSLAGLNHKMGFRGTVNTLLNFGEGRHRPDGASGAIGYLVGRAGEGLAAMFHMMNEARIGVGLGATMLGYTGYLHALDYARQRPQGRPIASALGKDSNSLQVPIIEHPDVRRMLLAQKSWVEAALGLNLFCARLVDDLKTGDETEQHRAHDLLELLTPIAKSWPSQWCLEANVLAIQVHGGYGYTRDYKVEQFYRDNRLNPIHEGTHGIQGLDLLGRKLRVGNGALLKRFEHELESSRKALVALDHAAPAGRKGHWRGYFDRLDHWLGQVRAALDVLYALDDPNRTLANASLMLEAFGHGVMAWIWIEQYRVAEQRLIEIAQLQDTSSLQAEVDFLEGKRMACHYFYEYELPRCDALFARLIAADDTTLRMKDVWF